jgi:prepilin-type N-terminal cleavage/methylation domain-containing protein
MQSVQQLKEGYARLRQRRGDAGFTIIEVMIVLAIAGLILLIVFLAVPALQRNAHNTAIKNDVAGLLGAMNEFTNNNNGTVPPNQATVVVGTTATIGINCATAGSNCATAKVGFVTSASIVSAIPAAAPAIGTVTLVTNATCNGNAPTTTGATPRNYVAYFQLEGNSVQCTSS